VTLTEEAVIEALRPVQDPELHRSIVDLGMVRRVDLAPPVVSVAVDLTIAGCPLRNEIERSVTAAVVALDGVEEVRLEFGVMTDEQREELRRSLHGDPGATAGSQQAHGHAEGRAIPFAHPDNRTRVILVASGKGGVGKSSVTTNLAVALAARTNSDGSRPKVAIVDADVWGFSIPRMLGVDRDPVVIDEMIVPPEAHGVRCISMGFFVEENQPVIWRGPMLHKALEQFLTDVFWDDPDYLLVDLPPGTGDIALSLSQFLPRSELLVVTTPQAAAQKVAQRAAYMAHKVRITVAGVIENMSWFVGDDGKRYELFGAGGGQELADQLGVPLLAQVPLVPLLREGGDVGAPIAAQPGTEAGAVFAALAERVDVELAPKKRFRSELRIV
jgi:ATP-binding protein involved in chromosome partitioning